MLKGLPLEYTADILIVDDTLANLQLLSTLLKEEGYKVRPANNGAMALQAVATKKPDLILLDIKMPEMSGYEVCTALKDNPETKNIPVLFISALNDVTDKIQAFNVGALDYINKPFQFEEVKARVATHLQLKAYEDDMEARIAFSVHEIEVLNQEIIDTQQELIFTMGQICETRSHETGLHVKRVAEYSYLLAKLYGYEDLELIKQAASMHDIGKVAIPDSILNKPGELTAEEWKIMKTHSHLGFQMLSVSQRPLFKLAATITLEHHEKWDGTGYPSGLKGEEISVAGRITAVADVFDALGAIRCYKPAKSLDRILEIFQQEKGKHFDPDMVTLFFDHLDDFIAIRNKYTQYE
ncbi:MAG: two-component system response regulator [Methylobacter sp.]|uniref:response regulator n=1 Tax=Methylobacter sp. TaxID=2051955 RepID=UPI002487F573|nr:two-component system response regulator [Methylobacter sp.]MDI1277934.1 two-component system response regulator [Methylobacter sp.]